MTFEDVLNDIRKLIGLRLSSIRPGAEITILSIDEEQDNLMLRTAAVATRSRPLRELRTIWDLMMQRPVVHVDEALHGSGTSRNQPETILANLPYVEWLKVNGKKNLAFVNKQTHPYGTLREMDVFQADELKTKLREQSRSNAPKGLIVTNDISDVVSALSRRCSGTTKMLENGIYSYLTDTDSFIVATGNVGLPEGTYIIVKVSRLPRAGTILSLAQKEYELFSMGATRLLLTT